MHNLRGFWTLLKRESMRFLLLPNQTLLPSVLTLTLYIVVFGFFLGTRISRIEGVPYIVFIFPGLLLMDVVMASFQNSATSLFISRWERFIEDLLVAPVSFFQMVAALTLAAVLRGLIVGLLCALAGLWLTKSSLAHPFLLLWALIASSCAFGAFGMLAGLWASRWDQVAIVQNYLITPMVFLGGVFYATSTLPENFRWVNEANPLFYMVSTVRFAFLGRADVSYAQGMWVTCSIAFTLLSLAVLLFKRGYNLRT